MSRSQPPSCGILVVDKPRGVTSHDVVKRTRRALGVREIGHTGTLDPLATGVLVIAIGEATKLAPWLTAQDKSYEATIALGVETDTLDAEGRETRRIVPSAELQRALGALAQSSRSTLSPLLQAALNAELDRTSQVPPAYSAIHHLGERAYVRARRGETSDLPAREVRVRRLSLLACNADPPWIAVEADVTKGYYVRSLARDLALALGTVGHLTSLRRTRSGSFSLDEALPFLPQPPLEDFAARILALPVAAGRALPTARLTVAGVTDARHGRPVTAVDIDGSQPGPHAWLDAAGGLVAIGEIDASGRGRVLRGFAE